MLAGIVRDDFIQDVKCESLIPWARYSAFITTRSSNCSRYRFPSNVSQSVGGEELVRPEERWESELVGVRLVEYGVDERAVVLFQHLGPVVTPGDKVVELFVQVVGRTLRSGSRVAGSTPRGELCPCRTGFFPVRVVEIEHRVQRMVVHVLCLRDAVDVLTVNRVPSHRDVIDAAWRHIRVRCGISYHYSGNPPHLVRSAHRHIRHIPKLLRAHR